MNILQCIPIHRGHFSPDNLRKTSITHPLGRDPRGWDMRVCREFHVWPKFNTRISCAACNIVLCCIAIYRDSRWGRTKCLLFCIPFQMQRKYMNFDYNHICNNNNNIVPNCLINSKSPLARVMALQQAIIWTKDDPLQWRIYASPGPNHLTH